MGTTIPNNGLFSQHTATGSPFPVVTDERFTRRDNFISSDYMLGRVGMTPRRLISARAMAFTSSAVREQVLALTGKPSVRAGMRWNSISN